MEKTKFVGNLSKFKAECGRFESERLRPIVREMKSLQRLARRILRQVNQNRADLYSVDSFYQCEVPDGWNPDMVENCQDLLGVVDECEGSLTRLLDSIRRTDVVG